MNTTSNTRNKILGETLGDQKQDNINSENAKPKSKNYFRWVLKAWNILIERILFI